MEGTVAPHPVTDPSAGLSSGGGPRFHPVTRDVDCPYCRGEANAVDLGPLVDAVYCISLQEQPHRTAQAIALFHRLGLCRSVTFFRPTRLPGRAVSWAIWDSHRRVARHALAQGQRRVLIFEDDVAISQAWPRVVARLERAYAHLPDSWSGLFLGHFPLQAYFVTPHLLRARSVCAHAYIANLPLLHWLAETDPGDPEIPVSRVVGHAMDGAFAELPGMYALYPMVATQRAMGDGHGLSYRDLLILYGARPAEAVAVLFSPLHRLIMEIARARHPDHEIRPI